ncbi:MAG TPA: M13 family metallopeptidase N-terminal domain-containing protein, partial [Pseudomonadales bacterium]|nr:M13 family metallopeptidase N-terminal domain-containing protein [Pseudomonadales bacterium]
MSNPLTRRQVLKGAGALALSTSAWPRRLFAASPEKTKPAFGPWGFDLSGMDRSVKPGDDFFSFGGGTWVRNTAIPADRSRWGTFPMLRDQVEFDTRDVIEQAADNSLPDGSVARKVVDYYQSYMDVARIDTLGLTPAKADLTRIASATTYDDIVAFATTNDIRAALPLSINVSLDAKRPDTYIIRISQSGLGLPDRDYYLNKDARFAEIREQYQGYIDTLLSLADYPDPAGSAAAIFDVERRIAPLHWPRAKSRNRDLTY